jgi:hypothetical protein
MHSQRFHFAAWVATCLLLRGSALAHAATVTAGQHFLAPNAPNQFISIQVTGGEAVSGVDLFLQVGDGGTAAGGDDVGPTITAMDFGGIGIFAANNTGVFMDSTPLLWGATTTTNPGTTVPANGRLVILAVSTAGITSGRYDLVLNPPSTGPTLFPGVTTTLVSGWIQIGSPPTADFNGDGYVTGADLSAWRTWFGLGATATKSQGDADGDQDVDGSDFLAWQRQVNSPSVATAMASVPEPAALALAIATGVAFLSMPRRRVPVCARQASPP